MKMLLEGTDLDYPIKVKNLLGPDHEEYFFTKLALRLFGDCDDASMIIIRHMYAFYLESEPASRETFNDVLMIGHNYTLSSLVSHAMEDVEYDSLCAIVTDKDVVLKDYLTLGEAEDRLPKYLIFGHDARITHPEWLFAFSKDEEATA